MIADAGPPLAKPTAARHIEPMLSRLRRGGSREARAPRKTPEAPAGRRVYAVGDIHGRRDLLDQTHRAILTDAGSASGLEKVCVYIGDYVDRGNDSRGVVDTLLSAPLVGFRTVHLLGNHEDMMLRCLEDSSSIPLWMANGGDATLSSYGVDWRRHADSGDFETLRAAFRIAVPVSHLRFLRGLTPSHVEGDYLFVHAGIRPGRDIGQQDLQDLIWIRDEFLSSDTDHGNVVVHGHSISPEPDLRDNRIGIDTGAFATGKLTCLVLDGATRRFLQT
jgi:Calcineurin-like phosphoesterase